MKKLFFTLIALTLFFGCATKQKPAVVPEPVITVTEAEASQEQTAGEAVPIAKKIEIGRYKNGTPKGYEYINLETGIVQAREIVDYSGSTSITGRIPDGLVIQYDPQGNTIADLNYNNGRLEGTVKEYDPEGKVTAVRSYKAGRPHGLTREFWPNGTVKEEINFINGIISGAVRKYSENGTLLSVENYIDDALDGVSREFYVTGTIKKQTEYTGGKIDGYLEVYDKSGIMRAKYYYSRGVLSGVSESFYEDGSINTQVMYVEGKREGDTKIYSNNNSDKPIYIDTYKNDKRTRRKAYAATGNLLFVLDY
jgi:antitoxin component YwqK of YwqJK toxin-antitoxin module